MTYESPITILRTDMETKIEGEILTAVHKVGVFVDKDELIKALKYDREQYQKGYQDATPKWISVKDEQKPKHLEQVLCTYVFDGDTEKYVAVLTYFAYGDNGYVTGAHFTDEGMCDMRVTHWMALPEAARETGE